MSKEDNVSLMITSISLIIVLTLMGLGINANIQRSDEYEFLERYVGEYYIHKNDTVKCIFLIRNLSSDNKFILMDLYGNDFRINSDEIYKLKKLKFIPERFKR